MRALFSVKILVPVVIVLGAALGACSLERHEYPGYCPDGVLDASEGCDDGNIEDGDGCNAKCSPEPGWSCSTEAKDKPSTCSPVCGDGMLLAEEVCDDHNAADGDGCDDTCTTEPGYVCLGAPSQCHETCGDGDLDEGETCDDGALEDDDGCSVNCAVEPGWDCPNNACAPICGDGVLLGAEACDDGNTAPGDGCTADCKTIETGWTCDDAGSACLPICGDLLTVGDEECSDGNKENGDGCDTTCSIEDGWSCPTGNTCFPICGDGKKVGQEQCDDGGTQSGDGCNSSCIPEMGWDCPTPGMSCVPHCGDGMVVAGEPCDDGNMSAGDGCVNCASEPGWTCSENACTVNCGDTILITGKEECADGNSTSGDGCFNCKVEMGWMCSGNICTVNCGDTILLAGKEECADGNSVANDGCFNCKVETGWICPNNGMPCKTTCGDGITAGQEECDDGNTSNADECGDDCKIRGKTCGKPIKVSLGLGSSDTNVYAVTSTTAGGGAHTHPSFASAGPDRVFEVKVSLAGLPAYLTASLSRSGTSFQSVLYATKVCSSINSNDPWSDSRGPAGNPYFGGEVLSFPVQNSDVWYIFVDGETASDQGDYELTIELSVGGNCSDPVPVRLEPSVATAPLVITGTTSTYGQSTSGSCGGALQADMVYAFTPAVTGSYTFVLSPEPTFDAAIYLRSGCDLLTNVGTELACSNSMGNGAETLTANLDANTPYYLWVDGGAAGEVGDFTLTITPPPQ